MKLSYSKYRKYLDCPRLYHYNDIKKETAEEPNMYFALYGKLVESFFTKYTNYYTKKDIKLDKDEIRDILEDLWEYILRYNIVDWNVPWAKETPNQIFESAYLDILKNMKEFDFWKTSRSEVTINIFLKKSGDVLTSRLDFILNKKNEKIEILDGKGTAKVENVDKEQLYFYALLYLLKYNKLPDKLGFLFYRFQMIRYIDFDIDTIKGFKNKLALVKRSIKKDKEYKPNVKLSKHCKYCLYRFDCDAYKNQKEANYKKRKSKSSINLDTEGIVDFSF